VKKLIDGRFKILPKQSIVVNVDQHTPAYPEDIEGVAYLQILGYWIDGFKNTDGRA